MRVKSLKRFGTGESRKGGVGLSGQERTQSENKEGKRRKEYDTQAKVVDQGTGGEKREGA